MADDPSNASEHESAAKPARIRFSAILRRWWFMLVPLLAVTEIAVHLVQRRDTIEDTDWEAVASLVRAQTRTEDLVVVSPRWVGPLGRMHLGDGLMTTVRVARADESRFPKATEVAFQGAHDPTLQAWTVQRETAIGPFVVRHLVNPTYRPVLDDLVTHARHPRMTVVKVVGGKNRPCAWRKGAAVTGNLGFGPAAPAERFHCERGAWVGETILADLEYRPRRCIYAPAPGKKEILRLRFPKVRFGKRLEGHHALYVEAERNRKGTPVRIAFSSAGTPIGEARHEDGQGWIGFGFDTPTLAGKQGELTVDISSKSGNRRMYCFEVTTR